MARPNQTVLCQTCGQVHDNVGNHLYDYLEAVDEDLTCHICLQPLVNPTDTTCGHTYCAKCIRSVLRVHRQCPVDRSPLTAQDCRPSSLIIKRMLDKLPVVCPNTTYCDDVMQRSDLEAHLANRCKGNMSHCVHATQGCMFRGTRTALESHIRECPNTKQKGFVAIKTGGLTTIEIKRSSDEEFGISLVGGNETPLIVTIVQEIYPEGVIAKDGRLMPGDQIVEVNGKDLRDVSHYVARDALMRASSPIRLTMYREKAEERNKIDLLNVTLRKVKGKQLGIKIIAKKHSPGIYILDLVDHSIAFQDGRLHIDDRILQINGEDMTEGSPEQAAAIIKHSKETVKLIISRLSRSATPEIMPSVAQELAAAMVPLRNVSAVKVKRERQITISKPPSEFLGISVCGGVKGKCGDTPIFVSNVLPGGLADRKGHVKKGDILLAVNDTSLLNLTHPQAVSALKSAQGASITLSIIEGQEPNPPIRFSPSWLTWLSLPEYCQAACTILIKRKESKSLGFSIVGGCDCTHGTQPVYVKTLVPNGAAATGGALKCGDMILSVNDQSLVGVKHSLAVSFLKHAPGRTITLTVVSWPGSLL
ncbi:ligand of Numb protein X 2-like [Antedon mediterranea]|uniref:ligand of Numb protein X 2-like n=1 Tax=Antedon mediterranea TaxID=105859 RepID=UPI003AF4EDED